MCAVPCQCDVCAPPPDYADYSDRCVLQEMVHAAYSITGDAHTTVTYIKDTLEKTKDKHDALQRIKDEARMWEHEEARSKVIEITMNEFTTSQFSKRTADRMVTANGGALKKTRVSHVCTTSLSVRACSCLFLCVRKERRAGAVVVTHACCGAGVHRVIGRGDG